MDVAGIGEKGGRSYQRRKELCIHKVFASQKKISMPLLELTQQSSEGPCDLSAPTWVMAQLLDRVAWGMANGCSLNRAWLIGQAGRQSEPRGGQATSDSSGEGCPRRLLRGEENWGEESGEMPKRPKGAYKRGHHFQRVWLAPDFPEWRVEDDTWVPPPHRLLPLPSHLDS